MDEENGQNDVGVACVSQTLGYCQDELVYDLASVIVHHGEGFSSGHYTSYCWNNEAGTCLLIIIIIVIDDGMLIMFNI